MRKNDEGKYMQPEMAGLSTDTMILYKSEGDLYYGASLKESGGYEYISATQEEVDKKAVSIGKERYKHEIDFAFIIAVLQLILCFTIRNINAEIDLRILSVLTFFQIIYASTYINKGIYKWLKLYVQNNSSKNHAAEHKVINAYEALRRIPTLEEVKKFSMFHQRCGSMKRIYCFTNMCINIILNILYNSSCDIIIFYNIFMISLFITWVLNKLKVLKYLQIFCVTTPTETELKFALEAFKLFQQNRQVRSFM